MPEPRETLFTIDGGKGFTLPLPNGYSVSVQFGPGNYCQNHRYLSESENLAEAERKAGAKGSWNAECAVLDPDGDFVVLPFGEVTVQGHMDPDQVWQLIAWAVSL